VSPNRKDLQVVELLVEASGPGSAVIRTETYIDETGETKIEQTARYTEGVTITAYSQGDRVTEGEAT